MCGLFGFVNYGNVINTDIINDLCSNLAIESEARGSHATGYAYFNNKLNVYKAALPAHKVKFNFKKSISVLMGHTRHATQGNASSNQNNHPFIGATKDKMQFALAHNGVLSNDNTLRKKFCIPKTKIATDSYIATQLLEMKKSLNPESLRFMAEEVIGSFTFTVLDAKATLHIVKGDSPFALLHFKNLGLYVYASTDEILWRSLCSTRLLYEIKKSLNSTPPCIESITVSSGDILCIDRKGNLSQSTFEYNDYCGDNWWNYGGYSNKVIINDERHEYLENLFQAAKYLGFDEEDIELLNDYGYAPYEIEELLYDPQLFEEAVVEIKNDY